MKKIVIAVCCFISIPFCVFSHFGLRAGSTITVSFNKDETAVVHTAMEMFAQDYQRVFGGKVIVAFGGNIVVGTLGMGGMAEKAIDVKLIQQLKVHPEGYVIQVKNDILYILGSDKRGTAYGILEISRKIGVSPWEWWADATISKKEVFLLDNGFSEVKSPSVAHRGIFINDEDFGLNPWSYLTHEPSTIKGQIGPKTHARIFELLLRLRANMFWPAMHECSTAFYLTEGNKEMAEKYGIIIGASHCEPMMRNTNAEWKVAGTGEYDWVHNRENVLNFWEERVKELKKSDNIYTIGIRGVHDGKMQGANTLQEQKAALSGIFKDQREMIAQNLNPTVEKVPQVFIPYKEVLEVYNMGLQVPEDVTLMWTDDNYGYIRRFPTEKERLRKGGNGIYYHISYWGRPHDYLWLSTNHPAQIYTQMKLAYDKGAKDMWVLNVGDIKPGEYLTELFMDMAWDINAIKNDKSGLDLHLKNWLAREFSATNAGSLQQIMNEYYRLAYIRKPEFMGNTRTEETNPKYKVVTDLDWSVDEVTKRIKAYEAIENRVIDLSRLIPKEKQDAWFQLVEYPVRGAAEMNKKQLYGQLARHAKAEWKSSDRAYDVIDSLTKKYNSLGNGKWKNMMSSRPRELPVFAKVPQTKAENPFPDPKAPKLVINGASYVNFLGEKPIAHGLGYEQGAVAIKKNSTTEYTFQLSGDSVIIEVALAPNHPVVGNKLRYQISLDGAVPKIVEFQTYDRSEEWKRNVLTNHALRKSSFSLKNTDKSNKHSLKIKAIDEGVVLDQVKFY